MKTPKLYVYLIQGSKNRNYTITVKSTSRVRARKRIACCGVKIIGYQGIKSAEPPNLGADNLARF